METPEIKQQLDKLDISEAEPVVVGSGIFDVLGIRASRDLDLLVSETTFRRIAAQDYEISYHSDGSEALLIGDVELMYDWFGEDAAVLATDATVIDGLKFMPLSEIRAWKLRQNRPKDRIDVKLIDDYIAKQQSV